MHVWWWITREGELYLRPTAGARQVFAPESRAWMVAVCGEAGWLPAVGTGTHRQTDKWTQYETTAGSAGCLADDLNSTRKNAPRAWRADEAAEELAWFCVCSIFIDVLIAWFAFVFTLVGGLIAV